MTEMKFIGENYKMRKGGGGGSKVKAFCSTDY